MVSFIFLNELFFFGLYLAASLWPLRFFIRDYRRNREWALSWSFILTIITMIFGTYFAISFFWVTPTNTLAYFSQNIIGMLFHVLLGFVFVKYFQSDKMKTILSYIFCVYFAWAYLFRGIEFANPSLSFDLVNIYDIYHIDLYSLVFIFIALRPLFVKYKYVTYLKITDNFCVVMGLICSVFAFLMGAGTLENLAIWVTYLNLIPYFTLFTYAVYMIFSRTVIIDRQFILKNLYWICGLTIFLIFFDGLGKYNTDPYLNCSYAGVLSSYGFHNTDLQARLWAFFVRGDLRVNTTFLFINIPVSNDLRRGEVNIPISFPYYFVLMLIFASVFWLIGYGLEYLQKRWNINRLADDIILPH